MSIDSERQVTVRLHPQMAARFDAACARMQLPSEVAIEEALIAWVEGVERLAASEDGAQGMAS